MAPPLGFTRARIEPCKFDHRERLRRERFVQFDHVDLLEIQPRQLQAFGIAYTGPTPISSGGQPAVANATNVP